MAWVEPAYSREQVNRAGKTLIDPDASAREQSEALRIVNNWRSSHSYPLNTLQVNLRRVAKDRDPDPTIAQRIKRLPSIRHKLERMPSMNLSRMHDLGGCRAVVASVETVDDIVDHYLHRSQIKHRMLRHDAYIAHPKDSGYRGVHLVYAYRSDKKTTYNDLRIELQIRSSLQHAWATAVETVGTFTQQALKSSLGQQEWLRFFALMSSALASREGTPLVPGTPTTRKELTKELRKRARDLEVVARLTAYGAALNFAERQMANAKGHTFLLQLNVKGPTLTLETHDDRTVAAERYAVVEKSVESDPSTDVVLVTVESLAALRRAYPNYFLDTTAFVEAVEEAIE